MSRRDKQDFNLSKATNESNLKNQAAIDKFFETGSLEDAPVLEYTRLTIGLPKQDLSRVLPDRLYLDTVDDRDGYDEVDSSFVSTGIVQTDELVGSVELSIEAPTLEALTDIRSFYSLRWTLAQRHLLVQEPLGSDTMIVAKEVGSDSWKGSMRAKLPKPVFMERGLPAGIGLVRNEPKIDCVWSSLSEDQAVTSAIGKIIIQFAWRGIELWGPYKEKLIDKIGKIVSLHNLRETSLR